VKLLVELVCLLPDVFDLIDNDVSPLGRSFTERIRVREFVFGMKVVLS
jgi:hypothetical protein